MALQRVLRGCSPLMTVPSLAERQTMAADASPAAPPPAAQPDADGALDPRFDTCGEANAAGYGPYVRGQDPEYDWYIDRDRDGVACER